MTYYNINLLSLGRLDGVTEASDEIVLMPSVALISVPDASVVEGWLTPSFVVVEFVISVEFVAVPDRQHFGFQ